MGGLVIARYSGLVAIVQIIERASLDKTDGISRKGQSSSDGATSCSCTDNLRMRQNWIEED